MRYAVVIEKARNNYGAYVPDLPGCVAAGATAEKVKTLIREAIDVYAMLEDGLPIPRPSSQAEYVEVELELELSAL